MEFLLGSLTTASFFLCLVLAYWLGTKQAKKQNKTNPISEEEKRKIEQFNDHFKALFAYDVDIAVQRKKVT